jgi:hypothetical protein
VDSGNVDDVDDDEVDDEVGAALVETSTGAVEDVVVAEVGNGASVSPLEPLDPHATRIRSDAGRTNRERRM